MSHPPPLNLIGMSYKPNFPKFLKLIQISLSFQSEPDMFHNLA